MSEMRYIDQDLWDFIEQYADLGNYDNYSKAQQDLAQRLQNIPLGMILNQPLKQEQKKEKAEKEDSLLRI